MSTSKINNNRSSTTWIKVILALLYLLPLFVIIMLVFLHIANDQKLSSDLLLNLPLLIGLGTISIYQAYRGLVLRNLIIPVGKGDTMRYRTWGEKAKKQVKDEAAIPVGIFWAILVLLFLGVAIRFLIESLLSV